MRLPFSRATTFVALIAALLTASGFTTPRSGAAGRDRGVRVTRGGPQRLDATDGPHSHEESDAVVTPATDLIEVANPSSASPDTQTAAVNEPTVFPPGPNPQARAPFASTPAPPALRGTKVHAPDRAPPSA